MFIIYFIKENLSFKKNKQKQIQMNPEAGWERTGVRSGRHGGARQGGSSVGST